MAAGALVVVGLGGWVVFRTWQAYSALTDARATIADTLQLSVQDLLDGGTDRIAGAVDRLQEQSGRARDAVDDPVFSLATRLPFVGADLSGVKTIATTVDGIATQVLPPLVGLAGVVDPAVLLPQDHQFDLNPIIAAAPGLRHADDEVRSYLRQVADIRRDDVMTAIGSAADELSDRLTTVSSVTSRAATVTELIPPMLGSEGTRRYLVLFQNLAEARSTGGMFGSYAVMTVDHGRIVVGGQGATQRTIDRFDAPVAPLSADELNLYGLNIATISMDVNFTPDFPRAAALFSLMYQKRVDPAPIDGAIAVDPVALAGILKGYPPIDIGGTTVAASNLASFLLSDIYRMFPDDRDKTQRDTFTAAATGLALESLMSPPTDAARALRGARQGIADHRLLVYSAHPDEQSTLADIGLTGELPAVDVAGRPTFMVALADRTFRGSKLSFYLSGATTLTAGSCATDGSREVTMRMDLTFAGPASGLLEEISGSGPKAYTLTDEFRVYAPTGATFTAADVDGTPVEITHGSDFGREAGLFQTDFPPQSRKTVTLHFELPAPGVDDPGSVTPEVRIPPAVTAWPVDAPEFDACR
ncbi:MAG: DUF4012 domain-containing protein [Nakamurella sp.]